ncbi:tetraacyldisaccharide 4'-kinase [Rufibacter sp. DG15C]|uniref:tetraacyldisaccharide 4'-kinase n=1 Tax=Rufibacter sp. DG15C TaxID=1379909 RepID=UPI00082E3C62|nr:tetraacyldisaccharide 4'-kinase [Rufibacter sp. DG15C]
MPRILQYLLLPFSWLYGLVVTVRNYLYDTQVFATYQAPIPVICVGNLSVGGTGKTPQVEYLARLYKGKNIAILSRGYKRQTKGFVLGNEQATALSLGDEPFQYLQSLPYVKVAVCEKRAEGIQKLLALYHDLDLILLDDAFQHRAVKASFYLLLTDFGRLFTQDFLLPAGRLREPRNGAKRADAIVVTKCPESLSLQEQQAITQEIQEFSRAEIPVFFSRVRYGQAVGFGSGLTLSKKLVLVTGIVNATPLVEYLREQHYEILQHFEEADHAEYSPARIEEIYTYWTRVVDKDYVSIVMTQKDAVKWQQPANAQLMSEVPLFYVPIVNEFWPHVPSFDEYLQVAITGEGFHINS